MTSLNQIPTKRSSQPDGWAVWRVVLFTRWWLLVDHCVLRNWDRILVRAVKGFIFCWLAWSDSPLPWQRDVKLQQTKPNPQKVQSMRSRIRTVWILVGLYTRYNVVFRSIVMQCCYRLSCDIFAVDVCYLEKCNLQYQFCLNVTNHKYFLN